MSVYMMAQIVIDDRETYAKYEAGFAEAFAGHQGKMLAVDEHPRTLEGTWPYTRTVLIEWPDEASAMAWYESDEYQAIIKHRHAASVANLVMVKGIEV